MALHSAPPVTYPLGRSRFLACLMCAAWCLTGLLMLAWGVLAAAADMRPWLGAAALVIAGLVMARGWQRSPLGQLCWDGQGWTWESQVYRSGATLDAPKVALDLQGAMLLRLDNPAGASWWLWAERAAAAPLWLDLRRAVYARPRHELPTDILGAMPQSVAHGAKVEECDSAQPTLPR